MRLDLAFANLREFLPSKQSLFALDLGGGTGAAAVRLALLGFHVTLLDSSPAMLDLASRAAQESGAADTITLKLGDAARVADFFPAGTFDVILGHNILEYVDDPAAVLCGAAPLLRDSSQWKQLAFLKRMIKVGKDKTDAGEGRTIPMNDALFDALVEYRQWYEEDVAPVAPEFYVFPYGSNNQFDPTRPIGSFKTAWRNIKRRAGVELRIHDMRHTLATNLGENPEVSVETLLDICGWVSPEMLKTYVHIRTEARRKELASLPNPMATSSPVSDKTGTNDD